MRLALLAAGLVSACLGLTACGKEEATVTIRSEDGRTTHVNLKELNDRMREAGMPSELDAASMKDMAELAQKMKEATEASLGTDDLEGASQKAKALGERPLTGADIETWIALTPKVREAGGSPADKAKVLAGHGLSYPEWLVLSARVTQLRFAARMPAAVKDNAKITADIETIRPYLDRIDAALKRT